MAASRLTKHGSSRLREISAFPFRSGAWKNMRDRGRPYIVALTEQMACPPSIANRVGAMLLDNGKLFAEIRQKGLRDTGAKYLHQQFGQEFVDRSADPAEAGNHRRNGHHLLLGGREDERSGTALRPHAARNGAADRLGSRALSESADRATSARRRDDPDGPLQRHRESRERVTGAGRDYLRNRRTGSESFSRDSSTRRAAASRRAYASRKSIATCAATESWRSGNSACAPRRPMPPPK